MKSAPGGLKPRWTLNGKTLRTRVMRHFESLPILNEASIRYLIKRLQKCVLLFILLLGCLKAFHLDVGIKRE